MICRRHIRLGIALLLPLMVLRGLLPAGYMAVAGEGDLRIVMCAEVLALPGGADASSGDDHPPGSGNADCTFALSAGTLSPPVQPVLAILEPLRQVRFLSSAAEQLPPATGPPRVAPARAPPRLS